MSVTTTTLGRIAGTSAHWYPPGTLTAKILGFAAVLTVAAIVGKQICSLGVLEKGLNRIVVGVGMIPRGEVGLIFAGIGASLTVSGQPS